jgi:hypothetical protein
VPEVVEFTRSAPLTPDGNNVLACSGVKLERVGGPISNYEGAIRKPKDVLDSAEGVIL